MGSLKFNQLVHVIAGKHIGKSGRAYFVNNDNVQLKMEDNSFIFVDREDMNYKWTFADVQLFMPEDERAEWEQKIKDIQDHGYQSN
jgi:hypothetical protein